MTVLIGLWYPRARMLDAAVRVTVSHEKRKIRDAEILADVRF